MKKKKVFWFIIRSVLFLVITALVMEAVMLVVQRKDSHYKYADFFDAGDQVDVLYLGSSHVINAVDPVQIYRDYGYTGYNMGGHGSVLPSTYWELNLALQYCNPKVVFVDCYMLEKNYQYLDVMDESASEDMLNTSIEQLHLNMDCWPDSNVKEDAIKDLIQNESLQEDFLFDFELYHERWTELDSNDFLRLTGKEERNLLMGAEQRTGANTEVTLMDEGTALETETSGTAYLRKIIEECQTDGIQVVLTYLPMGEPTTDDMTAAATADKIAGEYGVPYLNMIQDENVVDLYTDLNDHGHSNSAGMQKISDYLGQWLSENESSILEDHRGENGYSLWDTRVQQEYDNEIDLVSAQENAYSAFVSLYGETSYDYAVYIKSGSPAISDTYLTSLVEKLTGTDGIEKAAAAGTGPYTFFVDGSGETPMKELVGGQEMETVNTFLGDISYIGMTDFAAIYKGTDTDANLLDMEEHYEDDIQILIFSPDTGEVLYHLYYNI